MKILEDPLLAAGVEKLSDIDIIDNVINKTDSKEEQKLDD